MLTMFVDDFQAPNLCSKYMAYINGKRFGNLEMCLPAQLGNPMVFISVRIPPGLLEVLNSPPFP